ncbi:MAG: outer membrane beta-barrel protein [Ignavibacteria bacterium]
MKTSKIFLAIVIVVFLSSAVFSQDKESILKYFENFKLSAYADAYYGWNTDKTSKVRKFDGMDMTRDEFRLNIAQLSLAYNSGGARGIVTFHYGDYVKYNWLTENPNLQEANVGFKMAKGLWFDAGYFLTHIGPEGMLKNNFVNSFSLPSFYEPFYQSGAKVSYEANKFSGSFYLINGYNVIEDNNKNKSIGVQLNYQVHDFVKLTYNNIIGNEQPSPLPGKTRILNNFIVNYGCPCAKWDAILSGELGSQEGSKLSDRTKTAYTYGGMLSVRYRFTKKFSATVRGDYYQDLDGVYSGLITNNSGIKGNGLTLGLEYKPIDAAYVRFQTRYLRLGEEQKVFYDNTNSRTDVNVSMGFTY